MQRFVNNNLLANIFFEGMQSFGGGILLIVILFATVFVVISAVVDKFRNLIFKHLFVYKIIDYCVNKVERIVSSNA